MASLWCACEGCFLVLITIYPRRCPAHMFREIDHPLLWKINKTTCLHCHKDSPTHTTDHAYCGCGGWEAWARTKEEIQQAHVQHCDYLRKQVPVVHELRWETGGGYLVGACSACRWKLHGSRRIIDQAFATYHYNYPSQGNGNEAPHEGNHSLCWLNETSGYCNWCDWRLSDRPKDAIERAYQAHLQNNVTK